MRLSGRMETMRALLATLLSLGWLLDAGALVRAQDQAQSATQEYPNRPIRMVVPFPAGGPTDNMARLIADRLAAVLGQPVVVENRGGGAGGSIGAKAVATAEPDGYTVLITPGGALTTGPAVHSNIGYDPAKAFAPVARLIELPQVIAVREDLPASSLAEVVAYAKANPGKISWGSQGFGTGPHLLAEMFKLEAGIDIVHVPYRGTAPMLAAILAGDVQIVADPLSTILPHIESGKLRPLAIPSAERSVKLPNVPTTTEAGYPKLQAPFWLGVVAPAGTPPAIIDKLNAALRESLAPREMRELLTNLGAEIKIGTPAEFGKLLADELAQWTAVVKAANIRVE
jgi:tripartite-type tricarboxylate transporter receptor subunit TctC